MNQPSSSIDSRASVARRIVLLVGTVVALSFLFAAQDAMRRGADGMPVNWSRALAMNGLDWVVWGALLPFIVLVGRRIRLDEPSARAARIVGWILLGIAFCATQAVLTGLVVRYADPRIFGMGGGPRSSASAPLGRFLLGWGMGTSSLNLLIFGMTAGVFHAAVYYRDLRARQLREVDLQTRLARAELNVLRLQLQPHFLFNALHTVSSLMVTDVPTAQRVVTHLGDLLRASLDHTARQEIPLRDELAFVTRYLDIQRARFRARLTVQIDVPDELADALVPSFVLQPLVENAIRHGIEPQPSGGRVWIGASRSGADVSITVRDDGSRRDESSSRSNGRGSGIGLSNIEARLTQLYGSAHTFRAERNASGQFEVTLTLPFHTDATLFPASVEPA